MKKPEILDTRIICESTNPLFPYFAWPSVARLSESTLGMTASGFRVKHVCPFGQRRAVLQPRRRRYLVRTRRNN